jgi:hypothetical protein
MDARRGASRNRLFIAPIRLRCFFGRDAKFLFKGSRKFTEILVAYPEPCLGYIAGPAFYQPPGVSQPLPQKVLVNRETEYGME